MKREEFQRLRNAFYSELCGIGRRTWIAYWAHRAETGKRLDKLADEMEQDYEKIKEISTLQGSEEFYSRVTEAEEIFKKWKIS